MHLAGLILSRCLHGIQTWLVGLESADAPGRPYIVKVLTRHSDLASGLGEC